MRSRVLNRNQLLAFAFLFPSVASAHGAEAAILAVGMWSLIVGGAVGVISGWLRWHPLLSFAGSLLILLLIMLVPSQQEPDSLKDIAVWAAILATIAVIPLATAFTLAFWLSGRLGRDIRSRSARKGEVDS